jgi:hypothetical protein
MSNLCVGKFPGMVLLPQFKSETKNGFEFRQNVTKMQHLEGAQSSPSCESLCD